MVPTRIIARHSIDQNQKGSIISVASAASGFITGVTIPVDGGYLIDNI